MKKVIQICNDLVNVGDRLAPYITERLFGVAVIPVFDALPADFAESPVLVGLGSCLGYYGEWRLHVWGTGYEPGYVDTAHRNNPGSRAQWVVHAVRGHVTRVILKLDSSVPIGDPAILMPRIYSPQAAPAATTRYFMHMENMERPPGVEDCETVSTSIDPFRAIDLIVASKFVFTEALHIAILAHAYGVPWAWSLNRHTRGMVKWYDWFSSIGVSGACFAPTELKRGREWYERARREFCPIDETRLMEAFPHAIVMRG